MRTRGQRRGRVVGLLAQALAVGVVALLVLLPAPAGAQQTAGPREPIDAAPLGRLGYPDTTVRGRLSTTDYFVPGPGDFTLADDNWLDVDLLPSPLLSRESVLTVFWNSQPLESQVIDAPAGRRRMSIRLPRDQVGPEINRIRVQALLRTESEVCGDEDDENPGRYLTILNTTRVRYSYADRLARPRLPLLGLQRYPAPFFQADAPQPSPVQLLVPAQPSSAELTALVRVGAQLGQFVAGKSLGVGLSREGEAADLAGSNVLLVGRQSAVPSLARVPLQGLRWGADGTLLDPGGQPVAADTGVILEGPSPWDPNRVALAVTGATDEAVTRAGLTMGSRSGLRALQGTFALVTEAAVAEQPGVSSAGFSLADLGRTDDTVSGVGDHTLSFTIDVPALTGRAGIPFDLVVSSSPLLDRGRSSLRVVLNGIPLASVSFRDLAPTRASTRIELPAASVRGGTNTVTVEMRLSLARLNDGQACGRIPTEQAWAVLHADSTFQTPAAGTEAPARGEAVTLANYPYPFVREGQLRETLLVVPDSLGDGASLVRLAGTLGRAARAEVLAPRAVRTSDFSPALAAGQDVILFGLPDQNPVIGQLGGRLPIEVGEQQRLVLSRELTIAVRDAALLGVLQQVPSPWSPGRSVLVVSATGGDGLRLAVEALRQGGLAGNAALVSRGERAAQPAGGPATPEPLAVGGPLPEPLQVTTYRLRPRVEVVDPAAQRRPPYVLGLAALSVAAAALVASGLAYQAFGRGPGVR